MVSVCGSADVEAIIWRILVCFEEMRMTGMKPLNGVRMIMIDGAGAGRVAGMLPPIIARDFKSETGLARAARLAAGAADRLGLGYYDLADAVTAVRRLCIGLSEMDLVVPPGHV